MIIDIDSLTYEIETIDVYEDFCKDKEKFDSREYLESSKFYDNGNKNVVSTMTDEIEGVTIAEFVGLRSKMYSFLKEDDKENKKTKRININVVKNIAHKEYKKTLIENKQTKFKMKIM